MKPRTSLRSRYWEKVSDLVAYSHRRESDCMGLGCCVKRKMVPLCFGHRDIWPLERPVCLMGMLRQSDHKRQVVALEELGMFGIVIEDCTLDGCHRAGCGMVPECMQGAGPKAPAAKWMEGQMAGPSLRMGYWIFLRGFESWSVCRNNVGFKCAIAANACFLYVRWLPSKVSIWWFMAAAVHLMTLACNVWGSAGDDSEAVRCA
jgi:hypothetical protein